MAGSIAGPDSIAKMESTKLSFGLHNWSQDELKVVAEVLEDCHLASARTIWMRLMRQLPGTEKKPRDIETLLERIAKFASRGRPGDASSVTALASAAADAESTNSMDAFLCLLDDLVPGGLDFSAELADIIIESASKASGQLAEAYLFLASLLDGRPNCGLNRLSPTTCRRLLSMLTNLLPAARSATEQSECLYRLLGLAHTSASLPRATVFRDRLQSLLKMPLSTQTGPSRSSDAGDSIATPFETWLRNRLGILEDYADYSINPLNLPDELLAAFPGSASAGEFHLANGDEQADDTFMRRYMRSRSNLSRELLVRGLCESESDDENFYKRLSTKVVVAKPTAQKKRGEERRKNPTSSSKNMKINSLTRKSNSASVKRKPDYKPVKVDRSPASSRARKRQRTDSEFNEDSTIHESKTDLPAEDSVLSLHASADPSEPSTIPTVQPAKRIRKQVGPSNKRRRAGVDHRSSGVEISTAELRSTEPPVEVDQVTIVDLSLKLATLPSTLPAQFLVEDSEHVATNVSCTDVTVQDICQKSATSSSSCTQAATSMATPMGMSSPTRAMTSVATPMPTTVAKSASTSQQSLPSVVPKNSRTVIVAVANQSMDNSSASGKENSTNVQTVLVDPFKVNLKKFIQERFVKKNIVDSNAATSSNLKSTRKTSIAAQQQPSVAAATTPKPSSSAASTSKPMTAQQQQLQRALLNSKPQMRRGRALTYVVQKTGSGQFSCVRDLLNGGFVKRVGPDIVLATTPTRSGLATLAGSAGDADSKTSTTTVAVSARTVSGPDNPVH